MIGEIIAIGDELTSGRILNSTSQFAAHQLFALGHEIVAMSTIGDSPKLIGAAVREALDRADFVIITGGLGPTSDDLTNEAVSSALGRPSAYHPDVLGQIDRFLSGDTSYSPPADLEKMAWLPVGAEVLKPEANMAGYLLVHDSKPIFILPGVPHEMRELLTEVVIPKLARFRGEEARHVRSRLYRIFGLPETEVNKRVRQFEQENSQVRIGYYPVFPEVHLSLTVFGGDEEEAQALFDIFDKKVCDALGKDIYSHDEVAMAELVGRLLMEREQTLFVAESCTGGLLAHLLTAVAGSSGYFIGGVTAYSNAIKERLLHVDPQILVQYGAVSTETARAMAQGGREVSRADFTLSITGIAGPGGGTPEKPVGTVCFGLAGDGFIADQRLTFSGSREHIQTLAAWSALNMIRTKLLED